MPHGEGVAGGLLVGGIETPRPDAAETVAVGEEIEQLSVGAPGRLHVLAGSIGDGDPVLTGHRKNAIDWHYEDLRGGRLGARMEGHPFAVGRESAVSENAAFGTLGGGGSEERRLPSAETAMVVPQAVQMASTAPPARGTEKMFPLESL